jgi:hypothetical protein
VYAVTDDLQVLLLDNFHRTRVWWPQGRHVQLIDGAGGRVTADLPWSDLAATEDAKTVVGVRLDRLQVWDAAWREQKKMGEEVAKIFPPGAVSLSRDGSLAFVCYRLVGLASGKDVPWPKARQTGAMPSAYPIAAVTPDGRHVVVPNGFWVEVLDAKTGAMVHAVGPLPGTVVAVAATDGGKVFAAGGAEVKAWDVTTRAELITLKAGADVTALWVSPDGKTVMTGAGTAVRCYDAVSGHETAALEGHAGAVRGLVLDRGWAFSAADDRTLRAWDVATGKETDRIAVEAPRALVRVGTGLALLDRRGVITVYKVSR